MAMSKSAADSYVYAKASGMLAKSFVGERASRLFSVRSLSELWSLLFTEEVPAVPEALLARALEDNAQKTFISQYKKLIQNYSKPAPVLVALVHFYDYDNLKEIGAALSLGEKAIPGIVDTSPYSLIDYSRWPDIKAMTQNGPLAWYDTVPLITDQQRLDYRMDCQYVHEIWDSAKKIDSSCRASVLELIREHFSIENILWSIRLRQYYNMDTDIILSHLAYSTLAQDEDDPFVVEAVKTLAWELDDYEKWSSWKYASLLNPHEDGVVWSVDSRWISNAYQALYVRKAYNMFHQFPFTECPLICWFLIKRHELDNIRTASESLRLSVDAVQAMQMAGVSEVKNG